MTDSIPTRTMIYLRTGKFVRGTLTNATRSMIYDTREGIIRAINGGPNSVISIETDRGWHMVPAGTVDYVAILENEDAVTA